MPYIYQHSRSTVKALKASITSRNQGGGKKKSGTPPSVGTGTFSIWKGLTRAYVSPAQRRKVFCINQVGGVGSGVYQTRAPADGVKKPCYNANLMKMRFS